MRACLAAVVALALLLPASAGAHAFLRTSTPPTGASLAEAPRSVTLRFTEPVSAALTHVELLDGRGTAITGARVARGATPSELRLVLPHLANGAYRIAYSTVSEDDLHVTRGALVFGAGTSAPPAGRQAPTPPGTSFAESAGHVLDLVALAVLIAVCALLAGPLPSPVRARVARFAQIALPPMAIGGALALTGKASQLPLGEVLAHTAWGHAMLVREAGVIAVLIALGLRRPRLAAVLLLPVAVAEAASGHAASLDALAIASMTLHVLAAGVWVGGLVVLALVLPGLEQRDVLATLARFGRIAAVSVAMLLVTGIYSAGRQVASLDALLSTTYGWSLAAKLALLVVTGALGLAGLRAIHRRRPSLRLLGAEATLAVGMLVAAAVLLSSAPARGPQFARPVQPLAGTPLASGTAGDLLVDLSAAPNRPGENFVTATILDTLRPAPAPVRRVMLTFTRGEHRVAVPATRLDATHWQVTGTQLSAEGSWTIALAAERPGLAPATFSTPWTVASPVLPQPAQRARYSQRPLQPILTAAALALAALACLALVWRARARLALPRSSAA